MSGETICVRFPTIMSGVVLRWYPTGMAYVDGCEIANAGRDEVWIHESCPPDIAEQARDAHEAIRDAYVGRLHPEIDTSRWETHRTVGFLSRDLVPVAGGEHRG